jgi:cytochrome c biogenesis protein CcdA
LDAGIFRNVAAILMVGIGIVLVTPRFQASLAVASGPIGNWAENRFGGTAKAGLSGQFSVGLLLGIVWAPCVGPTLGAASVLAARGQNLGEVALTMLVFGVAAALPLLLLGIASRETMVRLRGRLMTTSRGAKIALGAILIALGLLILSGFDKKVEAVAVDLSPAWLTSLTTRF